MLTQAAETRVRPPSGPELALRTAALRSTDCAASIAWTQGLVVDWGVQTPLVEYIERQHRSQLSIVLAGRGYVTTDAGDVALGEGDLVLLDQRRHDAEGYGPTCPAGREGEVLVLEWDDGGRFGAAHRGAPELAHVSRRDVEVLRELTARATTTPAEAWFDQLAELLRALGLRTESKSIHPVVVAPHFQELYRALGTAKELIGAHVSITDVAEEMGLSERHVRRALDELSKRYGLNVDGWRSFVSDQRMHCTQIFLSVPQLSLRDVARLSGFRSQSALSHALAKRAGTTPARLARALHERWR